MVIEGFSLVVTLALAIVAEGFLAVLEEGTGYLSHSLGEAGKVEVLEEEDGVEKG